MRNKIRGVIVKIWYEVDDSEVVVDDNGMDHAIGGGNIVIHTR